MPRRKKIVKKIIKSPFLFLLLALVLGLGGWGLIRSLTVPADINLIASVEKNAASGQDKPYVTDENGCYLQPVQCVKAPCEPIKVCPTNTSNPNNAIPFGCTSWFDGCNTCQVSRGVLGACTKRACQIDPNNPPKPYCMAYETSTQISPIPEPTICAQDMYTCSGGTMVRRTGPRCEFICPSPTPVASSSPNIAGIATFSATKPCANNSFLSINFTCKDGRTKIISSGVCTSLVSAFKAAESSCNEVSQ